MYYGQNKEDEIIHNLIVSKYGNDFKGFVLDLGANDGITLSNSRFFIENGWSAVLVEAGRTPFEKLKLNSSQKNIQCINCAIGKTDGNLNFYESENLLNKDDVGLVSSLIMQETERWRNAGVNFCEYSVPCYTWESLRKEYNIDKHKFDLISIDIEGMDYEVLSQMNLTELDCKVLCVEFNGKEMNKYVEYAEKHGMKFMYQNPENLIFLK